MAQPTTRRLLTEAAAALAYLTKSSRGAANGVASLDATGKIPASQITPVQLTASPKSTTGAATAGVQMGGAGGQTTSPAAVTVTVPAQSQAVTARILVPAFTIAATAASGTPSPPVSTVVQRSVDGGTNWATVAFLDSTTTFNSHQAATPLTEASPLWTPLAAAGTATMFRVVATTTSPTNYLSGFTLAAATLSYQLFPTAP